MHCKLVWKLIYKEDKGHEAKEKKGDEHFIHSQREISLPNGGCSIEIFK